MDYNLILSKLNAGDLAGSFPSIREKARMLGNWFIADEAENLWMTYRHMMQFMLSGVKDPQSESMRKDIEEKLRTLLTKMERQERMNVHKEHKYVSIRKSLQNLPSMEAIVNALEQVSADIEQLNSDELIRESIRVYNQENLEKDKEAALSRLFYWVWTSDPWTNSDVNQANRVIFSDSISNNDKAVLVSATTLSLLEYNDCAKQLFLLDCYLHEDVQVSQRALIGFIITYYLNREQYSFCEDLHERLLIYKEDPIFVSDLYSSITQLMLSCTTEKVTSKMREDIMPALMMSQLTKAKKNNSLNLDIEEMTKNGENPEWVDEEKISAKVKEMADLQLDGADVYFSSFASMKGYSFFSEMSHWFYPFAIDTPLVPEIKKILNSSIGNIVKLMLKASPFCNSDKYSLCFTFSSIGNFGSSIIENQVNEQLQGNVQIDDLVEEAEKIEPQKKDVRRQYIFDLYRFFYVNPYHNQFINPFKLMNESPIDPTSDTWLNEILGSRKEELTQYAEFLMRKEFYTIAEKIFTIVAVNEFDETLASVWQKLGFCKQKLGKQIDAMHAYSVANHLKPNSKWTLTHLASMSVQAKDYKNALKYYKALLDIDEENMKFIIGAANMMMETDDYESALTLLHKANFIDEGNDTVMLNLAWCLIMMRSNDKAMKHILEMLSADANNKRAKELYAIVMLIDNNVREAYRAISDISGNEMTEELKNKLRTLADAQVIDSSTVQLFTDAITLQIE